MTATEQRLPEAPVEPFHIVVKDNDQGATMYIGLCVNDPVIDRVKNGDIIDPHMLIVIRQNGHDVMRKLEPLNNLITHVTFTRQGDYTAHALVVYPGTDTSVAQMKQLLLEKDNTGTYQHGVFYSLEDEIYESFEGSVGPKKRRHTAKVERVQYESVQPIHISANNFATPSAKWKTGLARMFFADNDRTQCHLRGRVLASIPMLLFVLPLHYLVKFFWLAVCLVVGWLYGLQPKHVIKPGRYGSFSAVFGGVRWDRSIWIYKRKPGSYATMYAERRPLAILSIFAAWLLLIAAGIAGYISLASGESWISRFLSVLMYVGFVIGIVVAFLGLVWLGDFVIDKRHDPEAQRNRIARRRRRSMNEAELLAQELASASCVQQGIPTTIDTLVKRRRLSPVVVYHSTKDKVCKPFAR